MEKKKIFRTIVGHLINIVWSLFWAALCGFCVYFGVPFCIDMTSEILLDLSYAFAIVVFVAVWFLNYTDVQKFIDRL